MKKHLHNHETNRIPDLEQSLEEHLYSKLEPEPFNAVQMTREEFHKLWRRQKGIPLTTSEEETTRTTVDKISQDFGNKVNKIDSSNLFLENKYEHMISRLYETLVQQVIDPNTSNKESNTSSARDRQQFVRMLNIPLTEELEDFLVKIRRNLNEIHQLNSTSDIIEDQQVIQALLLTLPRS